MKPNEKRLMYLPLLALFVLFPGCSKKTENASVGGEKDLIPFEIAMGPVNYNRVLTPIAIEEGYFQDGGLDIQLVSMEAGTAQYPGVLSGKLKLTNSGSGRLQLMIAENEDTDIVFIGGSMTAGSFILARPENVPQYQALATLVTHPENISQYQEQVTKILSGKKIALEKGGAPELGLLGGLRENGVDISKIEIIPIDNQPTGMAALLKGEVDLAVIGTPYRMSAINQGLVPIIHTDELAPHLNCCRITTTRANLNKNRGSYVNFLKAHIKAYKILQTDHEKTIEIALKYYSLDKETLQAELYDIGHLTLNPDLNTKALKEEYDRLNSLGIGTLTFGLDKYCDTSLYKEALEAVIIENPGDQFFLDMKQFFIEHNIY
jgi:NitT/TauT family transport system substrate-binding protein